MTEGKAHRAPAVQKSSCLSCSPHGSSGETRAPHPEFPLMLFACQKARVFLDLGMRGGQELDHIDFCR